MELIVDRWINIKEANEKEIIADSLSLCIRNIKVKDQNIEVGFFVSPDSHEVYKMIKARE